MALWPRKPKGNASLPEQPTALPPAAPPSVEVPDASPQHQPAATRSPPPQSAAVAQSPLGNAAVGADEFQERSAVSKRRLLALGQIVSLLARHPHYRGMPLAELETMVFPALMTGQYLVVEAQSRDTGVIAPVAMALWAVVSSEVDTRLSADLAQNFRLAPNEWRSGDNPWLVAAAGDQRVLRPALQKLQEAAHNGRGMKLRLKGPDGTMRVSLLDQLPAASGPATAPAPQA